MMCRSDFRSQRSKAAACILDCVRPPSLDMIHLTSLYSYSLGNLPFNQTLIAPLFPAFLRPDRESRNDHHHRFPSQWFKQRKEKEKNRRPVTAERHLPDLRHMLSHINAVFSMPTSCPSLYVALVTHAKEYEQRKPPVGVFSDLNCTAGRGGEGAGGPNLPI